MAQDFAEFESLARHYIKTSTKHIEALRTLLNRDEDRDIMTEANDIFEDTYKEMAELQKKMAETGMIDIF